MLTPKLTGDSRRMAATRLRAVKSAGLPAAATVLTILALAALLVLLPSCGGGGEGGGTLTGRVLSAQDGANDPVEGATVDAGGQQGVTDATGTYTITSVPLGQQPITVTAPTTGADAGKFLDYPAAGQVPISWDVVSGTNNVPDILLAVVGGGPPSAP
jgi:hypothetical protein